MNAKRKGEIVGATLTTHVPRLFLEGEAREKYIGKNSSTFFDALPQMYKEKIKDLDFDTFLVVDTHWWTTIGYVVNGNATIAGPYTSDEVPEMIHDYHFHYYGDQILAGYIERSGQSRGLAVSSYRHFPLPVHYPTLVPMHYLNPQKKHRVLTTSVAYTSSVAQELLYGEAIREAVEASGQRVVIVASGGLSHKFLPLEYIREFAGPEIANIPEYNRKRDEDFIRWLRQGKHKWALESVEEYRAKCFPEGRFAHYIRMISALGGAKCKIEATQYGKYEAAIGTGQAIFWFDTFR